MDSVNKVIPFHKHASKPVINWERLEVIRATTYPRVSPKVLALIRELFESPAKTGFNLSIDDYDDGYPSDPIDVAPPPRGRTLDHGPPRSVRRQS